MPVLGAFSTSSSVCWLSACSDYERGSLPAWRQQAQCSVPHLAQACFSCWTAGQMLADVHLPDLEIRYSGKPLCYVPGGLKYMVSSVCNLLVPEWWQMLLLISLPGSLHPYMKHKPLLLCESGKNSTKYQSSNGLIEDS